LTVEQNIRDALSHLTAAEKKAARALLAEYPIAGLTPVAEFAKTAGTSPPTVLRFVARIGYASYPAFQQALRREIQESLLSPLDKGRPRSVEPAAAPSAISETFDRIRDNLARTARDLPRAEIDEACALLGDTRSRCYLLGGRFTDSIAAYMATHLRIVRPGVQRFDGQVSTWRDQILDIRAGDVAVIFDIRRYQEDILTVARSLADRKARIILITDQWLSPVARYARIVLPCRIDIGLTWDSSAALLALTEIIINRVTAESWDRSKERMEYLELAHGHHGGQGGGEAAD
jgi:DNA-binding MurR/RpiR family transcriptional regulator